MDTGSRGLPPLAKKLHLLYCVIFGYYQIYNYENKTFFHRKPD